MRTNAVVERTRNAVARSPRLLSLKEALTLADIAEKEKEVRNDISRGVLPAASVIRFDNSRMCFALFDVVTFAAVYGNRVFDSRELRKVALEKVHLVIHSHISTCHVARLSDDFNHCFGSDNFHAHWTANIDNYLSIDVGKACKDVKPRNQFVRRRARSRRRNRQHSRRSGGVQRNAHRRPPYRENGRQGRQLTRDIGRLSSSNGGRCEIREALLPGASAYWKAAL